MDILSKKLKAIDSVIIISLISFIFSVYAIDQNDQIFKNANSERMYNAKDWANNEIFSKNSLYKIALELNTSMHKEASQTVLEILEKYNRKI